MGPRLPSCRVFAPRSHAEHAAVSSWPVVLPVCRTRCQVPRSLPSPCRSHLAADGSGAVWARWPSYPEAVERCQVAEVTLGSGRHSRLSRRGWCSRPWYSRGSCTRPRLPPTSRPRSGSPLAAGRRRVVSAGCRTPEAVVRLPRLPRPLPSRRPSAAMAARGLWLRVVLAEAVVRVAEATEGFPPLRSPSAGNRLGARWPCAPRLLTASQAAAASISGHRLAQAEQPRARRAPGSPDGSSCGPAPRGALAPHLSLFRLVRRVASDNRQPKLPGACACRATMKSYHGHLFIHQKTTCSLLHQRCAAQPLVLIS